MNNDDQKNDSLIKEYQATQDMIKHYDDLIAAWQARSAERHS